MSDKLCDRCAEYAKDCECNEGPQDEGSGAAPCSAVRGYESFIDGNTLTMRFETCDDARRFWEWMMENTEHKQNNKPSNS